MADHTEQPSNNATALCPRCGNVNTDNRQYRNGGSHLALYRCSGGHEWVTTWPANQNTGVL